VRNPFRLPRSFLGATKNIGGVNAPVSRIELEHGVSSGVSLRSYGKGMIPIYEEHMTRLERGIGLDAWSEMEEMEKALIVASRRIRIAMHNLQEEAQIKKSERDSKRR